MRLTDCMHARVWAEIDLHQLPGYGLFNCVFSGFVLEKNVICAIVGVVFFDDARTISFTPVISECLDTLFGR